MRGTAPATKLKAAFEAPLSEIAAIFGLLLLLAPTGCD